ncbi:MAG: O-antigen ligase family protein [Prevotellaceae bacterium]|jgi:O-antigen ligase|nr:O-antigen ligase family protein [Prevotellaceae bacterium]
MNGLKIIKVEYILPTFLMLTFAIVLCCGIRLPSGFNNFIATQYYKTILAVVTVLPILFLLCSKYFRQIMYTRKILLIGIAMFLLSLIYRERYITNNTIVFLSCTLVFFAFERKFYKLHTIYILFFTYFLWHLVSYFWAIDFTGYKHFIVRYLPFIIIPLAFCLFRLQKREINLILMVLFRAALIFLFLSLCCWVLESRMLGLKLSDWFVSSKTNFGCYAPYNIVFWWTNYKHPTYNAIFYLTLLCFGLIFRQYKFEFKPGILELVLFAAASIIIVIITQSRTGLLVLGLIMLMFYFSFFRKNKKLFIINMMIFIFLTVLLSIIFNKEFSIFLHDETRIQNYATAFYYIKNHFWLGTGTGGMVQLFDSQQIANLVGYPLAKINIHNPHNQFVGDLMQTGIVGLLLSIAISVYLIYVSVKSKNILLFAFFILFFVVMMIEMPLSLDKGINYFVLFTCVLMQNTKNKTQDVT